MDKFNDWANNMKAQVMATLPNALDAGAAAVAAQVVQPINMRNWKVYLWPQENQPEEWLLYITGGNKTCFGRCDHVDRMWNVCNPNSANSATMKLTDAVAIRSAANSPGLASWRTQATPRQPRLRVQ